MTRQDAFQTRLLAPPENCHSPGNRAPVRCCATPPWPAAGWQQHGRPLSLRIQDTTGVGPEAAANDSGTVSNAHDWLAMLRLC